MNIKKWIKTNTTDLKGKLVAVTGSTGGLGRELCRYLAALGAKLVLVDRNTDRSAALGEELCRIFPDIKISYIRADMADMDSVRSAVHELKAMKPYAVIYNAGAYKIPRYKCKEGYDNVFTINFLAPYYMTKELLPTLREYGGRFVAVGSVAHNYSVSDASDEDFSTRKKSSLVYGNAKRYLMFAMHELFRDEHSAKFALVHPGITVTGITSHYPKLIYAVIKYPMKVIFMRPKKAVLSILAGVFGQTGYGEWIGPKYFNVWGFPKKNILKTASPEEREKIFAAAERMYGEIASYKGDV